MKKKNLFVLLITAAALILLFISVVLFFLSAKPKENLTTKIIASIESILSDWESLEQETRDITITADMAAIYTPESLKKLCKLMGGDEELQISIYYTNFFNSYNRNGQIITTRDYVGIPFIDNEGYNIYYYFMVSGGKVYDIITGPWK